MITLLYGANTYEANRALLGLLANLSEKHPDITPERFDGSELELAQLPDLLQGVSLFNDYRILVIKLASTNKSLWTALEPYLETVSDTTDVIFVEAAVDKRTKTFKTLQKIANVQEYPEFGPRNMSTLQQWVANEAKRQNLTLPRDSVQLLLERVGYDQWQLANAITKLALVGDGSAACIRNLIEQSPSANAFELFESALRGDTARVRSILADLQLTNDPHALVGLLATQCFQLALVANSNKTPVELGKLIGSSPYPLQKLNPVARKLGRAHVQLAVQAITECDRDLKRSVAPPWTLITRALLKISAQTNAPA